MESNEVQHGMLPLGDYDEVQLSDFPWVLSKIVCGSVFEAGKYAEYLAVLMYARTGICDLVVCFLRFPRTAQSVSFCGFISVTSELVGAIV